MTWTKLGDEFGPESADLTNGEFRTHVEALVYSNWRLLDLFVPKSEVRRFGTSPTAAEDIDGLVGKGWWKDAGRYWFVGVRFPEWQRDKAQVEHRRAQLAEAQKRSRAHKAGDHSLCLPSSKCLSTVDSTDDPGRDGSGREALRPKVKSNRSAPRLVAADHAVVGERQPSDSVAISQNRRDHNGSVQRADDAQHIPLDVHLQSPADGRNAREAQPHCPVCGTGFETKDTGRPRQFCSPRCRLIAWRASQRTEGQRA